MAGRKLTEGWSEKSNEWTGGLMGEEKMSDNVGAELIPVARPGSLWRKIPERRKWRHDMQISRPRFH